MDKQYVVYHAGNSICETDEVDDLRVFLWGRSCDGRYVILFDDYFFTFDEPDIDKFIDRLLSMSLQD